jgi:hypothetical protein
MPLLSFYRGDNVIEVSILSTCTKFASSLLTKFKIDGVSRNSHGYGGLLHCGPHNFWIFLLACSMLQDSDAPPCLRVPHWEVNGPCGA